MSKPKILILGAGYGGLTTAVNLQKKISSDSAEIILINKNNYHYETTWLHEVAAGSISPEKASYPIESVLNNKILFLEETVLSINVEKKLVNTNKDSHSFDYLVIGLGFEGETFGIKGLAEYSLGLTNLENAVKVKEHIHGNFEKWSTSEEKDNSLLSIVVGGAGFSGIEFLGELVNELPKLCDKFNIPKELVKITSAEGSPSILPGFDPNLVDYTKKFLESKGVEFSIGTPIVEATNEGVFIKKNETENTFLATKNIVWAAGIRGNKLIEECGIDSNRARISVNEDLSAPNYPNIFIVGDCSFLINKETNRPYPPTAQMAMQQGVHIAKNIQKLLRNEETLPYVYKDKGAVCSLGNGKAVANALGFKLKGKTANALKKVVDDRALFLIGGSKLVLKKGKFNFL